MGWFSLSARPIRQPGKRRWRVREAPGPLTAHEAWAVVQPLAHALDPGARLTLLTSDLNLNASGQAWEWEFGFHLPRRRAAALLSLGPEAGADPEDAPLELVERVRPAAEGPRAVLPDRFRDSPEVVAEFTARGVDYESGRTDMKLEARVGPDGRAEWVTWGWDGEETTAFVA